MGMQINVSRQKHAAVIKLTGRLDAACAQQFEDACMRHVRDGILDLLVDFSALEYISSAGLRVLLVIGQRLSKLDGRIMLGNVGGQNKEVFDLAGLNAWVLRDGNWQSDGAGQ